MPISRRIWIRLLALATLETISTVTIAADAPTKLPKTMHAAAIDKAGGPEVLTVHTLPVPQVGAGEVLIAIHSAGVAIWDADIRQRMVYINKPQFPFVMGSDGAGLVAAVGPTVKAFKIGDAVYAYCWDNPKGGFYAEYVAVPANCVARLPKGVTLEAAGALGASGLTALQGIDGALHIKPGETLIIHGASGAVGTLAIQIAKLRGAKILATASGDDGIALVRRLGADAAVDGRSGDITAAARSFAPQGIDAVLALAGGESLERCMAALRSGGRLAFPRGVEPEPKARDGITVVAYDAIEGPEDLELARLNQAVEAAPFEIPIAAEYSLAEAAKAHERLAAGHLLGKIVLRVR
jgi:NADPH:quinone reductase-like Zn-dependent oxidoreductase